MHKTLLKIGKSFVQKAFITCNPPCSKLCVLCSNFYFARSFVLRLRTMILFWQTFVLQIGSPNGAFLSICTPLCTMVFFRAIVRAQNCAQNRAILRAKNCALLRAPNCAQNRAILRAKKCTILRAPNCAQNRAILHAKKCALFRAPIVLKIVQSFVQKIVQSFVHQIVFKIVQSFVHQIVPSFVVNIATLRALNLPLLFSRIFSTSLDSTKILVIFFLKSSC